MNALLPLLCFLPMASALGCYIAGRFSKPLRDTLVALTGIVVFALAVLTALQPALSFSIPGFCGLGLNLKADGFRSLYACVAAFMWMMTGLFSRQYFAHYHNRNRYYFFNLMTLGATLGVFLSDDLYTTFIFFEIMSLTSYAWVAHEETPGAMRAAGTYLAVAVIGGLTTLMGLFLLWHEVGTLSFTGLKAALAEGGNTVTTAAAWLTLVGFAAKAGLYPLHIWLPKAHPVAPAPASALLSGILTKSGVFGLIVICANIMPGNAAFGNALLVFAAVTMFLGALLALLSTDLKRTLACSSMSQIGFITVGLSMMVLLGEEGSLAAYGSVMHMVNHSLIKLCLFMAAGVVYMNLHRLDLNDVRGFGRGKPVLHIAFLLGALSIACIPPIGSGYNSKSLLHESILEYVHLLQASGGAWQPYKALEVLFVISGGLTIAYMTKLYICLFWEKHPTRQAEFDAMNGKYLTKQSAVALLGSAVLLPLLGALPQLLMSPMGARSAAFFGQEAIAAPIHYFSLENLTGALQSIVIGAATYLLIVRPLLMRKEGGAKVYVDRWPARLDLENSVYRPLLALLTVLATGVTRLVAELPERVIVLMRGNVFRKLQARKPVPVGNRFTYKVGCMMNSVTAALNNTILQQHPLRTDFEYVLDAAWQAVASGLRRFTASVSFGLLLLCIGLFLTCVYLLRY
ncbi:MAG: proton-conducting transporter membrane subunit [Eubacteriales bacterium]|nr:proton-conducting transporter membrane subunit [Eubacteriales bacterium]